MPTIKDNMTYSTKTTYSTNDSITETSKSNFTNSFYSSSSIYHY